MREIVRPSLTLLIVFSVALGALYPAAVTAIAQAVFPFEANGSLLHDGTRTVGSDLVGQPFSDRGYFWSRPSATTPVPYHGGSSGGSNLGPTNPALRRGVEARVASIRAADTGNEELVPVDLVTASGSGLDPHVSLAAAFFQVRRVARARGLAEENVRGLVEQSIEPRTLGILGEPRVNVLRLNLALDRMARQGKQ